MGLTHSAVLSGEARNKVVIRLNALRAGFGTWRRRRSSTKMRVQSNVKGTTKTSIATMDAGYRSLGLMGMNIIRISLDALKSCWLEVTRTVF